MEIGKYEQMVEKWKKESSKEREDSESVPFGTALAEALAHAINSCIKKNAGMSELSNSS